jgi:hypothetical protein
MSLINPTPGEFLDRLTILELKIAADPLDCFEEERKKIEQFLPPEEAIGKKKFRELYEALYGTNAEIWRLENAIRKGDKPETIGTWADIGYFAMKIARLNDKRREIVREFDERHGVESERKYYDNEEPRGA